MSTYDMIAIGASMTIIAFVPGFVIGFLICLWGMKWGIDNGKVYICFSDGTELGIKPEE